jgi:hypothetical protein
MGVVARARSPALKSACFAPDAAGATRARRIVDRGGTRQSLPTERQIRGQALTLARCSPRSRVLRPVCHRGPSRPSASLSFAESWFVDVQGEQFLERFSCFLVVKLGLFSILFCTGTSRV